MAGLLALELGGLADAVHALSGTRAARIIHAADPAYVLRQAAYATARSTDLADRAAFITFEADALGRTAGIARAADATRRAADTLPDAELLAVTADAVMRADLPALTGAFDMAAAAIVDGLIAFPMTELVARFRVALLVLATPVSIVPSVMAPVTTANDGSIATATGVDRNY